MSPSHPLLVNLSFLLDKPTGISNYATNVVPHLQTLEPTLLSARSFQANSALAASNIYWVPNNLTPAQGKLGHLRRLLWTQFQLPKIYRELGANLLFSPVPETPLFSCCRSVVMVHDLIPLRFPNRRSPLFPYFRYYIPRVVAQAQHVITNSEATARDVVEWFGVPANQVTAIPLAVDLARFRPLDLPPQNYFLYVGRHDPHKNLQRALRAFAQVRDRHEVEFWLAGPQDTRFTPQLQQLARELGVTEAIKFLSYVPDDDLLRLFNQALGFVFPSLWEGFGLPVLEAMACGTPAIASNRSSLPEVAGDAAILVNPLNVSELATAMGELVDNSATRSQLRQAGIARAAQFSWTKTGQATAAVLQQFL